ncbi:hypothetical protein [Candidiatus Paracoxiella cheracis]|uniref:hypothetical protein n=1 Tax=Candidiatus Paracoxiella cheracis TaxID=3405120 RepID=UPI003BF59A06
MKFRPAIKAVPHFLDQEFEKFFDGDLPDQAFNVVNGDDSDHDKAPEFPKEAVANSP